MIKTKHLEKTSLAEQAYHQIRALVLDHEIKPDEAVGIDALASRLGVSQTPIREALARLEGDRLVVRLRSGRYKAAPRMSDEDFAHLYDARLLIEPEASALAAVNRPEQALRILQDAVQQSAAAGTGTRSQDFVGFVDADALFHHTIAQSCGNSFIGGALVQLQANHRISSIYRQRGVFDAPSVVQEHLAIFQAISDRDPDAARAAMHDHVERSRQDILEWIARRA